jgi:hypothetical protein
MPIFEIIHNNETLVKWQFVFGSSAREQGSIHGEQSVEAIPDFWK